MAKRITTIFALVIASLIPSVLLFLLFGELNDAGFGTQTIKLGGPVAAFFVTLTFLWKMYRELQPDAKLRDLVGKWEIDSISEKSGRRAASDSSISLNNGLLEISGGTFFDVDDGGKKTKPIGEWSVEMAVSDGRRIRYFYNLTDRMSTSQNQWRGLVEMTLQSEEIPTFTGTWQVIGQDVRQGEITMRRAH